MELPIRATQLGRVAAAVERFQPREPGETDEVLICRWLMLHVISTVRHVETQAWVEARPQMFAVDTLFEPVT